MFENIKMNDTIRGRLEHVVTEFKKFSEVLDADKYHESAIQIIRMATCSICQILHGNLRGEISHDDMVKLLKVFINSEKRINKLVVLLTDKESCWYEPIKMALQIESMEDINRCISHADNDVCTVINRALLTYRSKSKAEELFNLLKTEMSPENKNKLTILVSDIAIFLDPSILKNNPETKNYDNKPVMDNCGQHVHGPNYTCKDHVPTNVFPNPTVSVPPSQPQQTNPIPSILPGQQTPGSINAKAFDAMNKINGSGQETAVSALGIAHNMVKQAIDGETVSAGSITEKLNSRRNVVRNRLIFPDGTPDNIKEAIISRLASDTGYKYYTKLMNEIGLVNYNVTFNDINNFHLTAMNIEKTARSELNCIGGNNYNVNTFPVNSFDTPVSDRMNNIDPAVIQYYQNN